MKANLKAEEIISIFENFRKGCPLDKQMLAVLSGGLAATLMSGRQRIKKFSEDREFCAGMMVGITLLLETMKIPEFPQFTDEELLRDSIFNAGRCAAKENI